MSMKNNRIVLILLLSLIGIGFSGYLSVAELGGGVCPTITSVAGLPPCVLGLFMYVIIFILALSLIIEKRKK